MAGLLRLSLPRWKLLLLAEDGLCFILSLGISLWMEARLAGREPALPALGAGQLLFLGAAYLVALYIADAYDHQQDYRRASSLFTIGVAGLAAALMVSATSHLLTKPFLPPRLLLIQAGTFVLLAGFWRYLFSAWFFIPHLLRRTLIVGAGGSGRRIVEIIREFPRCGLLPVGFVDDDPAKVGQRVHGLPVLGTSADLPALMVKHQASFVIVAITHRKEPQLINQLIKACWQGCRLVDMPSIYETITGRVPTSHISEEWLYQWNLNSVRLYYRYLKRLLDLVMAALLLLATLPLFLLIALAIKLDSPGPVFFYQERLGRDRRPFHIIKFRTMFHNKGEVGPIWTDPNDGRLTRVGRFIRRVRLDELPQVFNIFRGEMSFIGPRPLVHCDYKEGIPFYNYRFLVRPGLTGWAQVAFPQGVAEEDTLEKVKYDIYYIKNLSFLLDVAILLRTFRVVLFGLGH